MALASGTKLGPYEVLAPLGAGGMGEVYRARDTRLGRAVALKVISSRLSSDPTRQQRFDREARAISSLQHPNICTLYDIGREGEIDYLVMEYLEGNTLAARLHRGALPVTDVLRYGTEIADALDTAHRQGIVHRDLKPGNIFITERGECKVLDFGLAKLEEEVADPDADTAVLTGPGIALGTVAYMSPEQARGETLDARTDIFSLGAVLYEMATGKAAFGGKTSALVFKAILDENPSPISLRDARLPQRLQDVLGKALEKDRDLRYQSAADLRTDLKRLTRDSDSTKLSAAGFEGSPAGSRAKKWKAVLLALFVIAGLTGIVFMLHRTGPALFSLAGRSQSLPFQNFTIKQITDTGKVQSAAISPDGKYIVSVQSDQGEESMWLRNIATGSDTQIIPASPEVYSRPAFSPDGNYVYFLKRSGVAMTDLYRAPVLGGGSQRIAQDVDSNVTFSPDGRQIAYLRANDPEAGKFRLLAAPAEGGTETLLEAADIPGNGNENFPRYTDWSGDGRRIAYSYGQFSVEPGVLKEFDLKRQQEAFLARPPKSVVFDVAWLSADRLLVLYSEQGAGYIQAQVGWVSLQSGKILAVTRDTNSYSTLTVSADKRIAATVQVKTTRTLQLIPAAGLGKLSGSGIQVDRVSAFDWAADDTLITTDGSGLARIGSDGMRQASLASDASAAILSVGGCANGSIMVAWNFRSGIEGSSIWRVNRDGSDPNQLTRGPHDSSPVCAPDGKWVYYFDSLTTLMRVPAEGGQPEAVAGSAVANAFQNVGGIAFSGDGKRLILNSNIADPVTHRSRFRLAIVDVEGNPASAPLLIEPDPRMTTALFAGGAKFSPDGKAVVYVIREKGAEDLWMQPLDGSPGRRITNLAAERMADFRWSPDGKTLAVAREHDASDVVVLQETN